MGFLAIKSSKIHVPNNLLVGGVEIVILDHTLLWCRLFTDDHAFKVNFYDGVAVNADRIFVIYDFCDTIREFSMLSVKRDYLLSLVKRCLYEDIVVLFAESAVVRDYFDTALMGKVRSGR